MIELSNVSKIVKVNNEYKYILRNLNMSIKMGDFIAGMGPSGSGKSTLLNIIGGIDTYEEGMYSFNEQQIIRAQDRLRLRKTEIGIIVQSFALILNMSVLDNILIGKNNRELAFQIMKSLSIESLAERKVSNCSGGEKQRIAIARALIKKPKLLLADEPTGALDSKNGIMIMDLLKQLNADGLTIVMVTHDHKLAAMTKRVVNLNDGTLND